MNRTTQLTAAALGLSLASLVTTRGFKAFTVAEILAVAAFLSGLGLLILQRRASGHPALDWPRRLIVTGSAVGMGGLAIKLVFVLLGIGVTGHDMGSHELGQPNPLLQHIHHLFFNVGFLFMLVATLGLLIGQLRKRD